jgi:prepilin-type processing-associated H-X9-DG protein
MRDQGTTYGYTYLAHDRGGTQVTFMGGKHFAILLDPSRWPMLWELPDGFKVIGNVVNPSASSDPHFDGMNMAYGDGHVKFHHTEAGPGGSTMDPHVGDGLYPGQ